MTTLLSILPVNQMTVKDLVEIPLNTLMSLIQKQTTPKVNRKNWNAMMEREQGEENGKRTEVRRVVNTGNGMAKPVWTNANRINHSNKFIPRSIQLNAGRPNINFVRPNINTGRTNINSVRSRVNAIGSNVNTVRSRQPVPTKISNSISPKRPQMKEEWL
ncbi:hypothetical protein Tco_0235382 [Tanacetum coccineum]